MKSIIQIVALASLASLAIAPVASAATTYGADSLPDCDSAAKVVIFHGQHFDGTVYLHDADVTLSTRQVKAVKAIAAQGQTPVICQDSGVIVVTAQTVYNGLDSEVE